MNILKNKRWAYIGMFFLFVWVVVSIFTGNKMLSASAASQYENEFYYQKLGQNTRAKKFYSALDQMNQNGTFKTGNGKFDLIEHQILTDGEVSRYGAGDAALLKDFGAGKDAYYLDHPELFYINFDLLSLSMATQNGKSLAYIDAGRTNSYYAEGFTSVAQVETAIIEVKQKFEALDLSSLNSIQEKIAKINQQIIKDTQYSFTGAAGAADPHIRSIYGYAKYGTCVCEGYTKAFQYYCDLNQIPCEEIVGYLIHGEALEPHAWNYVKLDGIWYAVDCTLNDSNSEKAYYLLGEQTFSKDHIEEGIISQSNFDFQYPTLATFDYGNAKIHPVVTNNDADKTMNIKVNYNNLNATDLKEKDQLYLVIYIASGYNEDQSINWGFPSWLGSQYWANDLQTQKDTYVEIKQENSIPAVKFVVTDQAPTGTFAEQIGTYEQPITNIIAESDIIENCYYIKQNLPAYVKNMTLKDLNNQQSYNNWGVLPAEHSYEVSIEYVENLKLIDETKDFNLTILSDKGENLDPYVKVEELSWNQNNVFTFRFTPSQMYQHNSVTYQFHLDNLTTKSSNLAPKVATASFARKSAACSRVFNDGRLWMDVYGNPTLIDNSDLSLKDWTYTDSNGQTKKAAQNQRSQLALVVNKPIPAVENKLVDGVEQTEKGEILSSATYDLGIDICGCISKIPSGSYLKLSFGFPEGYSYQSQDEGVTFKVYHFKTKENGELDYDNPELLNCVITEYGIVIETNSFSPFMLVAVKDDDNKTKSVYARSINSFGTIQSAQAKALTTIESGSIEYTITPDTNYQIDYVLLNGKDVTNKVSNGKIVLSYEELGTSNTLDVSYVQQEVAIEEQTNGIVNLNKSFSTNLKIDQDEQPTTPTTPSESDKPGTSPVQPSTPTTPSESEPTTPNQPEENNDINIPAIVVPIVVVVVVLAVVTVAVIVLKKKKK